MSSPSSRPPQDPLGSDSEELDRGGYRHDRTVLEVAARPVAQPRGGVAHEQQPAELGTKKLTIFGFPRASPALSPAAPGSDSSSASQRIAVVPVHAIGERPPTPVQQPFEVSSPLEQVTAPQFGLSGEARRALRDELGHSPAAASEAPSHEAVQISRPAHTPMPARPQQYAQPASLSAPDGATAFVDMRSFVAQRIELPEVGKSDDSAASWQAGAVTEPSAPAPLHRELAQRAPLRSGIESDGVDLDTVLGRSSATRLWLFGGCALALLLAGLTVLLGGRGPSQEKAVAVVVERESARPAAPLAPERTRAAVAADVPPARGTSQREVSEPEPEPEPDAVPEPDERAVSAPAPAPTLAPTPGETEGSLENTSASPERAAILYIGGQYKEALAEYQLLALAAGPRSVYAEVTRILRRKIIDTCRRTQPQRAEQCKAL